MLYRSASLSHGLCALALIAVCCTPSPAHALLAKVFDFESPSQTTLSPDGQHLYVTGAGGLAVLQRDPSTGFLTFVERHNTDQGGVDGLDIPSSPVVSPDGRHVYVAELGEDVIAVFERDSVTGTLQLLETTPVGAPEAGVMAISPDGAHLYVATGEILVFERDGVTGSLALVQTGSFGTAFGQLEMTPDGAHLYASSIGEDALGAFERDPVSGMLTLVDTERNGEGGVTGMDAPRAPLLSPDGAQVYTLTGDDRWVIFSRDALTGALAFDQAQVLPVGDPRMSPDGAHVYLSRGLPGPGRIVAYARDAVTGRLTFIEVIQEGVRTFGLDGARRPILSADGLHLYTASSGQDVVTMLRRDASTGDLTYVPEQFGGSLPQPGKRLTIKTGRQGDVSTSWNTRDPATLSPAPRFINDPLCNFGRGAASSIRFVSNASGQDTGELMLHCAAWQRIGRNTGPGLKGYKYKDTSGLRPCFRLAVRDGLLRAKCSERRTGAALGFDLTEGIDQGEVTVVLTLGTLRYCATFDDLNGADGSDGRKFKGKNAPAPVACPPPLGSPSGAFVDTVRAGLE